MSDPEALLAEIEAFLSSEGWTPTRFGREAVSDPQFVFQLRDGREPRSSVRDRVRKFITRYREGIAA